MVHISFFHWICNILTLLTPLAVFEMRNGTIYTGVALNLLTIVAGLQYCLAGLIFYPDTGVLGLSGIAFLFMSYMAYQESKFKPIFYTWHFNNMELKIYTLYLPFFVALFFMILFPSSSLPGHVTGILTGYLYSYGYLNKLFPPSDILTAIEKKASPLINLIDKIVKFYKEDECVAIRTSNEYTPMLNGGSDIEQGPATPAATTSATFLNETRVLGSRDSAA
ncbi:Rhomboid protein 2 [Candida viswanathii]|uniref:Rhomboid-type serine protease 2 n=1 Tax=Candida viswanathii TaxID=5486 RepID=A0A367XQ68_9ASCO|nr:Rhomboid protein 2 [Candida viswanathii]